MSAKFYLQHLIIQNFATFRNQTIHFKTGLNAIIGETGSGKSLVLDALQLILGGRADKRVVRRDTEYALIEASFICHDQQVTNFLSHEGFPIEGNEIIIKRLIHKNGTTRNYINHLSCTVGFLSLFAKRFVDLVGQFENQKLLSEFYQLQLLDQYAEQTATVSSFQQQLKQYRSLLKEQQELIQSRVHREQRLDYLNFQLQEIEKLNPSSQDEDDLLKKKTFMLNFEKSQRVTHQAKELLEGGDESAGIFGHLKALSHLFHKNADIFGHSGELLCEIEDKIHALNDQISALMQDEIDPTELEGILDRLDLYQKLKKKFGGSVESILQTQIDFLKEKKSLDDLDLNCEELETKCQKLQLDLNKEAKAIHQKRLKYSAILGKALTEKVRQLKMNGATIQFELDTHEELSEMGISKISFLAETNPGEGYFKIKDIASGGELSRILLSLRQILSNHDSISIFLFDEIDTGIGGETANCIGKALCEVADHGQVIAITHLPQIAQFAQNLIVVNKDIQETENESRTESTVKEVMGKMIIKEVKAMAQLS